MRIAVVGAGVGGLAAAIAIRKSGGEPVILEQAPAFSQVGAGINVSANGMKALTWLGADERVRRSSVYSERSVFYDLETNARISALMLGEAGERLWGESFYHVLRADLIDALYAELPEETVRFGSVVADISDLGDHVRVRLADGAEVRADAAIGADGLNSAVRRSLFGTQDAHRTGYVAWRSLIDLEKRPMLDPGSEGRNWFGPRRHIITYPVAERRLLNFVGFVPDDEIVSRESWNASGDIGDLRASFRDVSEDVERMIDAVEEAFITGINFRHPLESWVRGNIALLGDAAHPVPPSAAQGACMALEDAVVLGRALERWGEEGFARFAREYEMRRIPRTNRLFGVAMNNFRTFNQSEPIEVRGRNGRLRGLRRLDPDSEATWGWLYSHDPVAAIDDPSPLDGLSAGATRNTLVRTESRRAFARWRDGFTALDFAAGEASLRLGYERFRESLEAVGATGEQTHVADVPCRVLAGDPDRPVVLHLHGGLFTMGSAYAELGYASRLRDAVGGTVVIPDYRLAPEHEAPAALEDVAAVYRQLRRDGSAPVIISGLDAGAALALLLAVCAGDEEAPLPDALFLVSPLVDLALHSPSIDANGTADPWLSRQFLAVQAASHVHGQEPSDPRISPIYASMPAVPARVYAAANEVIADDARRIGDALAEAGASAHVTLVEDSVHDFTLFEDLPETRSALADLAQLADETAAAARSTSHNDQIGAQ